MRPKVSVIMGIYNCEVTLSESIESILSQTYDNWELIMCDDHSTDNTPSIAKSYADRYPQKIKLIYNNSNVRLAATLNHCLKYTTGKYIARMDGDDISVPDRFEKQVKFLEEHPDYAVVGSSTMIFDENGDKGIRRLAQSEPQAKDLPKNCPFIHPTIMMRASTYKRLNGYRVLSYTQRGQDLDLWFRLYALGYKGYNIEEPLLRYREDKEALKKRKLKYSFDAARLIFEGIKSLKLPSNYYVYAIKPIISWFTPNILKIVYRSQVRESR